MQAAKMQERRVSLPNNASTDYNFDILYDKSLLSFLNKYLYGTVLVKTAPAEYMYLT